MLGHHEYSINSYQLYQNSHRNVNRLDTAPKLARGKSDLLSPRILKKKFRSAEALSSADECHCRFRYTQNEPLDRDLPVHSLERARRLRTVQWEGPSEARITTRSEESNFFCVISGSWDTNGAICKSPALRLLLES